jgi:hypothetical protein
MPYNCSQMQNIVTHSAIIRGSGNESNNRVFGSTVMKIDFDGNITKIESKKSTSSKEKKEVTPKSYLLNKSRLRNKIKAFSQIGDKRNFSKFITVSFPAGLPDINCKQALNTWLTKLRSMDKYFNYIWIAERQQNGTMHFHIITKTFFNIKVINLHMAKTIDYIIKTSRLRNINFSINKYNGVDIQVIYRVKELSQYVTKYVTKNDTKMEGYPSNCSKLISELFTRVQITDEEFKAVESRVKHIFSKTIPRAGLQNNIILETFVQKKGNSPPFSNIIDSANTLIYDLYLRRTKAVSRL